MKVLWIKQVSLMFSKQSNKVLNGVMTELNWQCEPLVNGTKNVILQVTYFLHGSMINLFICHITLYREKMTSYEKFISQSYTLEVQIIVWKISAFQCCKWREYGNADNWISKKFKLKWTTVKHFKQWSALRIIQPPPYIFRIIEWDEVR